MFWTACTLEGIARQVRYGQSTRITNKQTNKHMISKANNNNDYNYDQILGEKHE